MSGQIDPQVLQHIMGMLNQQKSDPFSRPMPGDALMGQGGMAAPQTQMMPQTSTVNAMPPAQEVNPADANGLPYNGQNMQLQERFPVQNRQTISTDFVDTQPGLPNLPDSFLGFGYGQFAPQEVKPMGLRQQYIQDMMKSFMPQGSPSMGQSHAPKLGGIGALGSM